LTENVYGESRVPAGVSGLQRAIRRSVFQPPLMIPSRSITTRAYRLHDGVKRHRTPSASTTGESVR